MGDYIAKYPYAQEIDKSGVHNNPYVVIGNITDNYPLTTPYTIVSTGAQSPTSSSNPSLSPTPTPTVPEFSWLAIIPLMISMLSVAVAFRRHRKTAKSNQ